MERFVDELLPRDVVTRAIREQMEKDGTNFVWLSMAPIEKETILSHFPNIYEHCLEEGYDVTKECIPVVPAQHYFMGGILGRQEQPHVHAAAVCSGRDKLQRCARSEPSGKQLSSGESCICKKSGKSYKEQWCLEKEQAV